MRAIEQTTVAKAVTLSGVGVHSGEPCKATLKPAIADSGVVFRRQNATIAATPANVSDTRFCTTLAASGSSIGTVEHFLAALSLAGVDNAIVDVDAGELPILDGSAAPIVDAIEKAGVRALPALRFAIRVLKPFEVVDGDRSIRIEPADARLLDMAIDFEDPAIGAQTLSLDLDEPVDCRRLALARTFCRLSDIDTLRAAGYSRGGSLENAVVVDGGRVLNPAGLRDPLEFALHKALDLVGDLALAGAPIIGRISARRPGHDINTRFIRAFLAEDHAYERVFQEASAMAVRA